MQKVIAMSQRYRYSSILLIQLIKTDFKLRYQNSALGYLWSLLRPLALFAILYVVFVKFIGLGTDIPHYPVYLLVGIVLWNYFVEVTTGSISAIVSKGNILRKINFPKYVIIFAGSFSALINLGINFAIVGLFMFLNDVPLTSSIVWLPLLVLQLFILSLGLAFFLSTAFVRLRDINYVWDVVMQGAFYATPILYPLSLVSGEVAKLLLLNPMAQIIQDVRYVLVADQTMTISSVYGSWLPRLVPVAMSILIALFAGLYFKHQSKNFAEEV